MPAQRRSSQHRSRTKPGTFIPSAVGWALLSQTIWLPLLAIDAHDRWQSKVRDLQPEVASTAAPDTAPATADHSARAGTALLLASSGQGRDPILDNGISRSLETTGPSATRPSAAAAGNAEAPQPSAPRAAATQRAMAAAQRPAAAAVQFHAPAIQPPDPLLGRFNRSEQLGGPISLSDGISARMPALALAERAQMNASGDPLAPLPSAWRQPMRRALQQLSGTRSSLPAIEMARVIYVPSSRISQPTTVPVAIQSDGSLDIFSKPSDPNVIEELRNWSNRQPNAAKRGITPAVIHLSPLPASTTAMVSPTGAAATALRTAAPTWRKTLMGPPPLPPLPAPAAQSAPSPGASSLGSVSLSRPEPTAPAPAASSPTAAASPTPAPTAAASPAPVASAAAVPSPTAAPTVSEPAAAAPVAPAAAPAP